jgi:hypothetical protein
VTKKLPIWTDTCNRFVAFLDIMGFKDMVLRNTHETVLNTMESFQRSIETIEKDAEMDLATGRIESNFSKNSPISGIVRPVFFSDSVILVSSDDSPLSASRVFAEVEWVWETAMTKGIPIKGAIAYGEHTANFDKHLHFGKPMIDAYELHNEVLLYGIVLHHSMEKYLISNDMMELFENYELHRYQTPLTDGKIYHYIVAFPQGHFFKQCNPESVISQLYNTVSGNTRRYVDNTLDFVRWLAKRKVRSS